MSLSLVQQRESCWIARELKSQYFNYFYCMTYSEEKKMHSEYYSAHSCFNHWWPKRVGFTHMGTYTTTEIMGALCKVLLHQNLNQWGSCPFQSNLTQAPLGAFFQNNLKKISVALPVGQQVKKAIILFSNP